MPEITSSIMSHDGKKKKKPKQGRESEGWALAVAIGLLWALALLVAWSA